MKPQNVTKDPNTQMVELRIELFNLRREVRPIKVLPVPHKGDVNGDNIRVILIYFAQIVELFEISPTYVLILT